MALSPRASAMQQFSGHVRYGPSARVQARLRREYIRRLRLNNPLANRGMNHKDTCHLDIDLWHSQRNVRTALSSIKFCAISRYGW